MYKPEKIDTINNIKLFHLTSVTTRSPGQKKILRKVWANKNEYMYGKIII